MTQYYSNSKDEYVDINTMHHQHIWYAFKKLCDRLEGLNICEHIWDDDYDNNNNLNEEKRISELLNEVEKLTSWNNYHRRQLARSEKELKVLQKSPNHKWKQSCVYTFSDIPNDYEGRDLVKQLKRYLNKDRYKVRVRGQYLDDKTKKEEGWQRYTYGQPLSKSKCIRVYIDEKKELNDVRR